MEIKITELLGVLGFVLAMITFIVTRLERRKKLLIDLYCDDLSKIDKDGEFLIQNGEPKDERIIIIDIINSGSRTIAIDKNSLTINLNNRKIKTYHVDWVGMEEFENPINPGQNYKFGVFLDNTVEQSQITNRHKGMHKIHVELTDLDEKKYTSSKKFNLLLEVDEITKI